MYLRKSAKDGMCKYTPFHQKHLNNIILEYDTVKNGKLTVKITEKSKIKKEFENYLQKYDKLLEKSEV